MVTSLVGAPAVNFLSPNFVSTATWVKIKLKIKLILILIRSYNVRTKDGAIYRRTSRHVKKPRHYAGEVPRTAAPEPLRCEILSEPQLPVTRRPTIPTVSQPNQLAEIYVADVPVVPSEVNELPLRSRYGRIYKPPIRYEA